MKPGPALPAAFDELAQTGGIDAAWALVRAKGGTTVFLPRRAGHRHWLSAVVGFEAAQKICAYYRGNHQSRLTIPMAAAAQKAARWTEALNSDLSLNDTAEIMQTHVRTVSRYRARQNRRKDDRQKDLF